MGYPPLEKLLPRAGSSIYKLVCMASKRAKELADGSPHLIDIPSSTKTATIALEEILLGKVLLRDVADQMLPDKRKALKAQKLEEPETKENIAQEQNV